MAVVCDPRSSTQTALPRYTSRTWRSAVGAITRGLGNCQGPVGCRNRHRHKLDHKIRRYGHHVPRTGRRRDTASQGSPDPKHNSVGPVIVAATQNWCACENTGTLLHTPCWLSLFLEFCKTPPNWELIMGREAIAKQRGKICAP